MNHDENNPDLQAWIEPEVEARLVAWVLGEASAFEAAELERLIGEKPELAIFKRRIEAVHGLVGQALRPEQAPMRLTFERRAKILQTIGAPEARPTAGEPDGTVVRPLAAIRRKQQRAWAWRIGFAACITFGAILAVSTIPSFQLTRSMRRPERLEPAEPRMIELPALESEGNPDQRIDAAIRSSVDERTFLKSKGVAYARTEPPAARNATDAQNELKYAREAQDLQKAARAQAPVIRPDPVGTTLTPSLSAIVEQRSIGGRMSAPASLAQEPTRARGLSSADQMWSSPPATGLTFSRTGTQTFGGQSGAVGNLEGPAQREAAYGGGGGRGSGGGRGPAPGGTSADRDSSRTFSLVAGAESAFGLRSETIATGIVGGASDSYADIGTGAGLNLTNGQAKKAEDTVVALSPFEITSPKDRGYFAANTLSGTRLSTKLEDLASSITVVTKQQFADTASRNVNDVFLYEANAENERKTQAFKAGDVPASPAAVDERLSKAKEAAKPAATLAPPPPPEPTRVELSTTKNPVSTFSLHVSDVSFRLAQAALARGEKPDPASIRAEEFYNAFDYGDPTPTTAEKISCHIEQAAHPLLQQRNLVRIAMKVPATGRGAGQPLHLTILLDTSGSMEREDRVASVRRALEVLASLLGASDRVTLIGFAQQPRLLAEELPGNQAVKLAEIAARTPFTGGTNMEEALKLAGELARRHREPAAQNRIVLLTDGAANLGDADPAQLATMIEAFRQQGLAFDACGVGTDGLDDAMLEALTRKGDGRYYVLDRPEDADAGFARQLAGAFRPAAVNVKVQVRFNPARVSRYRLIGFEQHRLREEDFRNDKVDAAELAAEEAAVAVYQVEVLPQGEGELGEVFVRFRDAATSDMVERSWTMLHDPHAPVFSRATPTMQLAGTAALLAEKLGGGETADLVDLAELAPVVNGLRGHFANDRRVQELVTMFEQLRRLNGK